MRFLLLFFLPLALLATRYDVIIIGSSPFSLFEALYQYHSGKSVLILEQAPDCGGAWKSINVCGIAHVDLGCHQIGHDAGLKMFLEEYAGCKIVSHDHPMLPFEPSNSPNGFYFSRGCFELIDHLLNLIGKTQIDLRVNSKVKHVLINEKTATVQTETANFTTDKLIVPQMCSFDLNQTLHMNGNSKHYHLYLLIQDPTAPRFSYSGSSISGISRMMNLTHYLGMENTGQHMIIIQTHNEQYFSDPNYFIEKLKEQNLIDASAYLLRSEPLIYEAAHFQHWNLQPMEKEVIEVLQTGHIQNLISYMPRWKEVLKPYRQVVGE